MIPMFSGTENIILENSKGSQTYTCRDIEGDDFGYTKVPGVLIVTRQSVAVQRGGVGGIPI